MAFHADFISRRHLYPISLGSMDTPRWALRVSAQSMILPPAMSSVTPVSQAELAEDRKSVSLDISIPPECFQDIVIANSRGSGIIRRGYRWGYLPDFQRSAL